MHSNANIQKVNAAPIPFNIIGVNHPTINTPIHSVNVATDIALPRMLLGYISPIITQQIGPKENAKQEI